MTIMIPRGHENEDNFVDILMNGSSYRIPKGKEVEWPIKSMSNADRIRAMSDEELATTIHALHLGWTGLWCDHHCENEGDDGCDKCIAEWLKQPAEEETNDTT